MTPSIFETMFTTIGQGFSPELYLVTTKVQGILWGTADITLIYFLLKIADMAQAAHGKAKAVWRYRLLLISALLVPFLVFMPTPKRFFVLESVIFGLQFAVLIHTLATDTQPILSFLRNIITCPDNQAPGSGVEQRKP